MGFQTDLQKLFVILQKNLFPENLTNKCISQSQQRWICKLGNNYVNLLIQGQASLLSKSRILLMWKMLSLKGFAHLWCINFRAQVVMLVLLVKPANTSPLEYASTYFPTGLRTCLDICRVQGLFDHPAHRIASWPWTLRLLSFKLSLRNPTKPDLNQQMKHINMTIVNAKWRTL